MSHHDGTIRPAHNYNFEQDGKPEFRVKVRSRDYVWYSRVYWKPAGGSDSFGRFKLEYRGYDSAGIAVYNDGEIGMVKSKGRLKVLSELTHDGGTLPGTLGIGHTRWATHGSPSDTNAHPHFNSDKSIVVVHNGIIENYLKLKKKLEKRGYQFISETDTEIIAHLLDCYYQGNPLQAITKIMHRMEGSYALGIIFKEHPEELYAVRKDSPLIVGHTDGGNIIASDVPAVLRYTRDVFFIENEEIVRMTGESMEFFNVDREGVRADRMGCERRREGRV